MNEVDVTGGSILGQVALSYSPFIDRRLAVAATRLTVIPLKPQTVPDVAQLLHEIGNVWPANGGRVSLNVASEGLLAALLQARPSANLMVEVPAFMAADPAHVESLVALHAAGSLLLLKGRPLVELPRAVLPCFRYAIVELDEDRRVGEAGGSATAHPGRVMPQVQAGVRSFDEAEAAFARGVEAVLGWPLETPPAPAVPRSAASGAAPRRAAGESLRTIVELIAAVDREAPIEQVEPLLKRDPSLAFRLLRMLNSPAFGLSIEIASFRHAVMILGYQRLKRWLALLLATAGDEPRLKPAMYAALRRGLFLEEVARAGGDEALRGEVFLCGVFSLLDRMLERPFAELLDSIRLPARVRDVLVEGAGPLAPWLALAQAVEGERLHEWRDAAERLMLSAREINRAQLRALAAAAELE